MIGPFSMVWGLGILLATVLLRRFQDRPVWQIFLLGTVVGAVFEYVCSVATEMAFGMIFWDYLEFQFNIGGRINIGILLASYAIQVVLLVGLVMLSAKTYRNLLLSDSSKPKLAAIFKAAKM